jgi:hypothetical protein
MTTELPVPTLVGFRDWCAEQDPARRYRYSDNKNCAFAQYLKALGYENPTVFGFVYRIGGGPEIPFEFAEAERTSLVIAGATPPTFGVLTKRISDHFAGIDVDTEEYYSAQAAQ